MVVVSPLKNGGFNHDKWWLKPRKMVVYMMKNGDLGASNGMEWMRFF
jgi:hypothetical protein